MTARTATARSPSRPGIRGGGAVAETVTLLGSTNIEIVSSFYWKSEVITKNPKNLLQISEYDRATYRNLLRRARRARSMHRLSRSCLYAAASPLAHFWPLSCAGNRNEDFGPERRQRS